MNARRRGAFRYGLEVSLDAGVSWSPLSPAAVAGVLASWYPSGSREAAARIRAAWSALAAGDALPSPLMPAYRYRRRDRWAPVQPPAPPAASPLLRAV